MTALTQKIHASLALTDHFGDRLTIFGSREDWLAARTPNRIGGSDVPAILGVSAWAGPWDIYRRKHLGISEEITPEKQALFDRGHAAEPAVLADYALATGRELLELPPCTIRHPDHEWLVGSPDGFAVDPELGLIGVEAKSAERVDGWGLQAEGVSATLDEDAPPFAEIRAGEDGAGLIPDTYLFQVLTYLAVTGLPAWDVHLVAVPFGWWEVLAAAQQRMPWADLLALAPEKGIHRRTVRVWRDEAAQSALVARVVDWRERHLVRGEEPLLDGSEACRDVLRDRCGVPADKQIRAATREETDLLVRFAQLRAAKKATEADLDEVQNRLRAAMGSAYGIAGGGFKVTRSVIAGRVTVDAKRLQAEWPDAYAACAKQGAEYDRFNLTTPKK